MQINLLIAPLNNIVSATETSCKTAPVFCQKNGFKKLVFLSKKLKILYILDHAICFKNLSNNVWRDFRLPVSAFATTTWNSFNGKFAAKIDFPIVHFMLSFLTLTF